MNTLSKLSTAGLLAALVSLTPSAGALAGPVSYRHWHSGYWHLHGAQAYVAPTAPMAPTMRIEDTARGLAFVAAGLAGPAAFLVAAPWQ